jgi:hypothetical protein
MSIIEDNLKEEILTKLQNISLQNLGNSSGYESNSEDDECNKTMGNKEIAKLKMTLKKKSKKLPLQNLKEKTDLVLNKKATVFNKEVN